MNDHIKTGLGFVVIVCMIIASGILLTYYSDQNDLEKERVLNDCLNTHKNSPCKNEKCAIETNDDIRINYATLLLQQYNSCLLEKGIKIQS